MSKLQVKYEDLKLQFEALRRSAINLVACYDPTDPDELSLLVADLAIASGCGSQTEAIRMVERSGRPVRSSHGDIGKDFRR